MQTGVMTNAINYYKQKSSSHDAYLYNNYWKLRLSPPKPRHIRVFWHNPRFRAYSEQCTQLLIQKIIKIQIQKNIKYKRFVAFVHRSVQYIHLFDLSKLNLPHCQPPLSRTPAHMVDPVSAGPGGHRCLPPHRCLSLRSCITAHVA